MTDTLAPDDWPTIEPLPPQVGRGLAGKGLTAGATSLLASAFPPLAPVIVGTSAAMQAFGDRLNQRQQESLANLVQSAQNECGMDAEEVVKRLAEDEDLCLLAAEAFDAARRSRLKTKAAALGTSLGSLLADATLIDLESVWIRIISVLEPPHVRILALFLEHTATMGTGSTIWGTGHTMRISEVGSQTGLNEAALPLIQDLMSAGLLVEVPPNGLVIGGPDAFGREVRATTLGAQAFARLSVAAL